MLYGCVRTYVHELGDHHERMRGALRLERPGLLVVKVYQHDVMCERDPAVRRRHPVNRVFGRLWRHDQPPGELRG